MIEVIDVGKRYGEQQVLSGVNLTVETGTIVGLAGRNGSGKSVLLRIISGLLKPDTGEVRYDGHKLPDGTFYPSSALSSIKSVLSRCIRAIAIL